MDIIILAIAIFIIVRSLGDMISTRRKVGLISGFILMTMGMAPFNSGFVEGLHKGHEKALQRAAERRAQLEQSTDHQDQQENKGVK